MKRLALCFVLFVFLAGSASAAIAQTAVYDVQQAANNNNGGCFVAGVGAGTDKSLTTTPAATLSVASVVAAVTTNITVSAGDYTVLASDAGNCLNITGGTATAGRYEILSVNTGTNTWTLDRSAGTAGQTVIGRMGGACATLASCWANVVAGNSLYVKCDATYTFAASPAGPAAVGSLFVQGYNSVHGDQGCRPTFQATAGSVTLVTASNSGSNVGLTFDGFILDCNSQTTSIGISATNGGSRIWKNLLIKNCTSTSAAIASALCFQCTVTGQVSGSSFTFNATGGGTCNQCYVLSPTSGTGSAFLMSNFSTCIACFAVGHPSATTIDLFSIPATSNNATIFGSAGFNSGRDIVRYTCASACNSLLMFNNIFYTAVGWCINTTTSLAGLSSTDDYNAVGNCNTGGGTGTRQNVTAGPNDKTLTVDPWTNSGSNDFTLNNLSGGGALLRRAASPGATAGGTGYLDIGPLQSNAIHQTVF